MKRFVVIAFIVIVPLVCLADEAKNEQSATVQSVVVEQQELAVPESVKTKSDQMQAAKELKVEEITTPSGLKYVVLQEGTGATPERGRNVTVHYTGWLEKDGKPGAQFDSSFSRNQPFVFPIGIGKVIKGWDEGVMSMKVGEKRRLIIPANLGYGNQNIPGLIPANSTLIFDVELLSVS